MAGYSVFHHADTEVDYCFIVEDNICRLIYNVKPESKLTANYSRCLFTLPKFCKCIVSGSYSFNFKCTLHL